MQLYLAWREVFPERNSYMVEMQGPAQRWLQRGLWRNECRDLRMKVQLSLLEILAGGSALDKQDFCNNWSLPTHGGSFWKPSSVTPTDRRKRKGRSQKATGWKNKFKAFQKQKPNWFCHCKDEHWDSSKGFCDKETTIFVQTGWYIKIT